MGAILGIVVVFALYVFWGGYVASTLWGWFVVPLGVKAITYWHAVGLTCVTGAFIGVRNDKSDESESVGDVVGKSILMMLFFPAFLLAVGWFANSHMS